MTDGRSRTGWG